MKIIIYALGKIFEQNKNKINWDNIEALCDKNTDKSVDNIIYGVPIVKPDSLCNFEYDFVAVFSTVFFEEIKRELVGQYAVSKDRIIPWREIVEDGKKYVPDILSFSRIYFKDRKYKKYLDIGMSYLPKKYLTKEELQFDEDIILDGLRSEGAEFNENLYDKVYKKDIRDYYDVAMLWKEPQYMENILEHVRKYAKHIVFYSCQNNVYDLKGVQNRLGQLGYARCISTVDGYFWVIDTDYKEVVNDVSIYVVTHKKYGINKEYPYIPFCVGDYYEEGYLTEHTGDNIAYLNKKINECTALYWIWKNTDSKYIGLNHYRRYFFNNEIESMDNYLDIEHINEIFQKYDIILPKAVYYEDVSIFEQVKNTMNPELCIKGHSLIRKKIEQSQPDYVEAFDSVMNGHAIFTCNMFVTKREILNQYCEWLFSFLIEAAEEIDVEGYDSYSQRVMGFFAERMWTVWLRRNRLRIKELPYVIIR